MAIPQTNVSWSGLQTEFGGANPILASEYRRGVYVPDLTSNSNVPTTNVDLAASKWRGSTKQNYYVSTNMYDTGSTLSAGSSYFSGGVPGYSWATLYSTSYTSITTPNVTYPLKLYVTGGGVQIGGGYRYYDPGCNLYGCGSTTYYYDRMKAPAITIWNSDSTAILAFAVSNDTREVNYTTNGGYTEYRSWSGVTMEAQPNTTYRVYYNCQFRGETGNNSFAWYGLSRPTCYVYNY